MKTDIHTLDFEKYEAIPFAVLAYSSRMGWVEISTPLSQAVASRQYDSTDCSRKMLLVNGQIIRKTENA